MNPTTKPTPVMKLPKIQDRIAAFNELNKQKQREENSHRARTKLGNIYGKFAAGSERTSERPTPKAMMMKIDWTSNEKKGFWRAM